jgi:hypothetical protein
VKYFWTFILSHHSKVRAKCPRKNAFLRACPKKCPKKLVGKELFFLLFYKSIKDCGGDGEFFGHFFFRKVVLDMSKMKNPLKKILKKSPAPPSVFFHQQKNKK